MMLARVANDLFWMGRYLERADHVARYSKTNYFSSLDAPNKISNSRSFVLESIGLMTGIPVELPAEEKKVLYAVAFDREFSSSIISLVTSARQNAHATRFLLSTEVWEAINKFYHFVNQYDKEAFLNTGLYDFTFQVSETCSALRSKLVTTLLHDEAYSVIMLGTYLERAIQVLRMINTKVIDVQKIQKANDHLGDYNYEWTTLLRCAETFDMSKKFYKKTPNQLETIDFLVLQRINPKSIIHCLEHVRSHIRRISVNAQFDRDGIDFRVGKILAHYQYLTINEIESDLPGFLNDALSVLGEIGMKVQKAYFSY